MLILFLSPMYRVQAQYSVCQLFYWYISFSFFAFPFQLQELVYPKYFCVTECIFFFTCLLSAGPVRERRVRWQTRLWIYSHIYILVFFSFSQQLCSSSKKLHFNRYLQSPPPRGGETTKIGRPPSGRKEPSTKFLST